MADTVTLNKRTFLVPIVPDKFVDLNDAQRTVSQLQQCLGDIVRSLQVVDVSWVVCSFTISGDKYIY